MDCANGRSQVCHEDCCIGEYPELKAWIALTSLVKSEVYTDDMFCHYRKPKPIARLLPETFDYSTYEHPRNVFVGGCKRVPCEGEFVISPDTGVCYDTPECPLNPFFTRCEGADTWSDTGCI